MIQKFSINKMKRQMARNTPDRVKRTFDPLKPQVEFELKEWQDWWMEQMNIKHEGKLMSYNAYRFDQVDRMVTAELELVIHDHSN